MRKLAKPEVVLAGGVNANVAVPGIGSDINHDTTVTGAVVTPTHCADVIACIDTE